VPPEDYRGFRGTPWGPRAARGGGKLAGTLASAGNREIAALCGGGREDNSGGGESRDGESYDSTTPCA